VSRDLLFIILKFWNSFHISGTVEATNFEFCTEIDHKMEIMRNSVKGVRKLGQVT